MAGCPWFDAVMPSPLVVESPRRLLAVASAVFTCLVIAGIWWTARTSLSLVLWPSSGPRICPAIYPGPPECTPGWHVAVAATASGAALAGFAAVAVSLARGRREHVRAGLTALVLIGLLALAVTAEPTRWLPFW